MPGPPMEPPVELRTTPVPATVVLSYSRHMGKRIILALAVFAVVTPLGANAGVNCRCRADGRFFGLGDLVCIKTADGPRLAQCAMALNNTSWTIVSDGCPFVWLTPLPAGFEGSTPLPARPGSGEPSPHAEVD